MSNVSPKPIKNDDVEFLRRVRGNIKHVPDPKVQRTVREIEKRLGQR